MGVHVLCFFLYPVVFCTFALYQRAQFLRSKCMEMAPYHPIPRYLKLRMEWPNVFVNFRAVSSSSSDFARSYVFGVMMSSRKNRL